MRQLTNFSNAVNKYVVIVAAFFTNAILWAQETTTTKSVDVNLDVNKGGGEWYVQPWAWIVGAAVFILLVIALARGGGKK